MPIRIRHKPSYIVVYVLLAWLAVLSIKVVLNGGAQGADTIILALLAGIMTFCCWWIYCQSTASVEIDAENNTVTCQSKSVFFRPRKSELALDRFSSVRSYISPGRTPKNIIELVTKSDGEALIVAYFEPGPVIAESFLSLPRASENIKAAELRQNIATHTNLIDQGFLGNRWVGAQLRK